MSESFKKIFPRAYFSRLLEDNIRSDGRANLDLRKTRLVGSVITTADSSALCTIGSTSVLCCIRFEVGPPIASKPSSGRIETKVEITGICSPNPSEQFPIRMEQAFRRIVEAGYIDLEDLCIQERRAVWVIKCHLTCLDDDGNLFDACVLALKGALAELRLPSDVVMAEDGIIKVLSNKREKQVRTNFSLMPLTFGIFDNGQVVIGDPTANEEAVLDGLISVLVDTNNGNCVAVVKSGGPPLSFAKLEECVTICTKRKVAS